MNAKSKACACFLFAERGHEAAQFYVSLLPDSRIDEVLNNGQHADPMIVLFTLAGSPMMIMTGGPRFEQTPAASISVLTRDQQETDRLWSLLTADGGAESYCGWLKDRYGVSWQIVPEALPRLLNDPDEAAATRAQRAMMQMKKIDIAGLEAAFGGH